MSIYSVALILNCIVGFLVWPGFMSWDSLFALSEARTGITVSNYPPVFSYIWHVVEFVVPGQGGMLLLQNGAILLGLAHLMVLLRIKYWISVATLIAFLTLPAVLGPMLVVWKDILMAAAMLLGFVFALQYHISRRRRFLIFSICFLLLGATCRLNAFPATVPIIAWLAWSWAQADGASISRTFMKAGLLSFVILIVIISAVGASLTWRLPDFRRIPPQYGQMWPQVFDMIGISACAGAVVLPAEFLGPDVAPEDLKKIYFPEHVQKSFAPALGDKRVLEAGFAAHNGLTREWISAIVSHPGCYIWHRGQVAKFLFGLNEGPVFYITHPDVDTNDLGVAMTKTPLTMRALAWVTGNSTSPTARFWVFFIFAGMLLAVAFNLRGPFQAAAMVAFLSGCFYSLSNLPTIPAADLRYQFWAFIAMIVVAITAVRSIVAVLYPTGEAMLSERFMQHQGGAV